MNFEENSEDFENAAYAGQNSGSVLVQRIYARTMNFFSALNDLGEGSSLRGNDKAHNALKDYLDFCYIFGGNGKINGAKNPLSISFEKNSFESINKPALPDLKRESSRSIVLIEFFTHCCINCIHSIEDIRQAYEEVVKERNSSSVSNPEEQKKKFKCDLKVISVHSPKFTREKDKESIKAFTQRMKMDYSEVVNDPNCLLWNELGICCWPTVLVLGPSPVGFEPNLLFTLMGEGHKEHLNLILASSLNYFDQKFEFDVSSIKSDENVLAEASVINTHSSVNGFLKYPGKVAYFQGLLAIADSGNNKIVVSTTGGQIKHIIGGSAQGSSDGDFKTAKFYNPQGIAFESEEVFYVADTGNHSIRKVNLISETVETLISSSWSCIIGDETIALKSPWDLVFYSKDVLLVAAAGNHRIFGYLFAKTKLFNVEHAENSFAVISGSGKEENRNNSYLLKASFAQPSGICVTNDGTVYIADSESSSIRSITSAGKVVGVIGGARDPTDLFAYGDSDGKGYEVKLQHPVGVCFSQSSSTVYFADTYNHKVKIINPETKECRTIIGDGTAGDQLGTFYEKTQGDSNVVMARLNEPGGVAFNEEAEELYIADTNNHRVLRANIKEHIVTILLSDNHGVSLSMSKSTTLLDRTFNIAIDPLQTSLDFEIIVTKLPKNFEGGQWRLSASNEESICKGDVDKGFDDEEGKLQVCLETFSMELSYTLKLDIFLCGPSSCYKKSLSFGIILTNEAKDEDKKHQDSKKISVKFEPSPGFFD